MTAAITRRGPSLLALAGVAVGAMAGAALRAGAGRVAPAAPGGFPWATFTVNVAGSLALGFLLAQVAGRRSARWAVPLLGAGVLGAFTTMSTFLVDVVVLAADGHPLVSAADLVGTTVAGVGAAWAGWTAGGGARRRSS